MYKCQCGKILTYPEIGLDSELNAKYAAAGHKFLCNGCIDNALEGENK